MMNKNKAVLDLAWMIHPYDKDDFLESYWGKQVLYINRSSTPDYYQGIMDLIDLDGVLNKGICEKREIEVAGDGNRLDWPVTRADGHARMPRIYDAFAKEKTLLIHSLEERHPPITAMCHQQNAQIHHPIEAAVFFSPSHHRALAAHYDPYELFILQLEGEKRWQLYAPLFRGPNKAAHIKHVEAQELGEPMLDIVLRPGDMLYMPSGTIHAPSTEEHASIHLAQSFLMTSWEDQLIHTLESLKGTDHPLNTPLPLGFLDRFSELEESLGFYLSRQPSHFDFQRSLMLWAQSFYQGCQPPSSGHFRQLMDIEQITLNDCCQHRNPSSFNVRVDGNHTFLWYGGTELRRPNTFYEAFKHVAENVCFRVRDLCGSLDDDEKLQLVRDMVSNGMITCSTIETDGRTPPRPYSD